MKRIAINFEETKNWRGGQRQERRDFPEIIPRRIYKKHGRKKIVILLACHTFFVARTVMRAFFFALGTWPCTVFVLRVWQKTVFVSRGLGWMISSAD